jgi:hypothetical protein
MRQWPGIHPDWIVIALVLGRLLAGAVALCGGCLLLAWLAMAATLRQ